VSERRISATARSEAPPEKVFALLEDATSWTEWARVPAARYEREGDPPPHGVGAIRSFGKRGVAREEVVAHEPPSHYAYVILSGLPVRGYRADVELAADGTGTRITWQGVFTPKYPGTGWLLQPFLRGFLRHFARGLARHAAA
jgi:hypothetical protein